MGCGSSAASWRAEAAPVEGKYYPCSSLKITLDNELQEAIKEVWDVEVLQNSKPMRVAETCARVLNEQGLWRGQWVQPNTLLSVSVQMMPGDLMVFENLLKVLSHAIGTKEDQAKLLFVVMDRDGSGALDRSELARLLVVASQRHLSDAAPPPELWQRYLQVSDDIISLVDDSGDGVVDAEEFASTLDEIRPSLEFAKYARGDGEWTKFREDQAERIRHFRALREKDEQKLAKERAAAAAAKPQPVDVNVEMDGRPTLYLTLQADSVLADLRDEVTRLTGMAAVKQAIFHKGEKVTGADVRLDALGLHTGCTLRVEEVVAPLAFNTQRAHPLVVLSGDNPLRPDIATDQQPPPPKPTKEKVKVLGGVLCVSAFATGRHDWRVRVLAAGDGNFFLGVCVPWANVRTTIVFNPSGDGDGWGISGNGMLYAPSGGGKVRSKLKRGEELEFRLDCDEQWLSIRSGQECIPGCEQITVPVTAKGLVPFVSFNSSRGAMLRIDGSSAGELQPPQRESRKELNGWRPNPRSAASGAGRRKKKKAADTMQSPGERMLVDPPAAAAFAMPKRAPRTLS